MPPERRQRRPNVSRAVRLLIRDVARHLPEFRHVRAEQVLVVAGEARRTSRATIRPLRFADTGKRRSSTTSRRKPMVSFRGKTVLYIITLRPLFFRASSAEKRVETIIHELFHMNALFNGTLDPAHRHSVLNGPAFEKALRPLVKRYLATCSAETIARLAHNGDVLVRQWLEKPSITYRPGSKERSRYSEAQTFLGPVRMITRSTRH